MRSFSVASRRPSSTHRRGRNRGRHSGTDPGWGPHAIGLASSLARGDFGTRLSLTYSLQRMAGNSAVTQFVVHGTVEVQRQDGPDDEVGQEIDFPQMEGEGKEGETTVFGKSLKLHGVTTAKYSSSWRVDNQKLTTSKSCKKCPKGQCVHVTGDLVSDYSVATNVQLPPVPDGLTECEQDKVQEFIDGPLTAHENEHVTRFETFNGPTSRSVNMDVCGAATATAKIQAMQARENKERQAAANKLSKAIDPWKKTVDLSACQT